MDRVIVVEDEDIIRKGLVYSVPWLELGCTVVAEARNGIEGIEAIAAYQPDIVLVDINMPVMDGLRMIKDTYQNYEYSAIILSGYSTFEYAQQAIRYGVLDYLLKPLNMDELETVVKKAQKELILRKNYLDKKKDQEEWRRIVVLDDIPDVAAENDVVNRMLDIIRANYKDKILMRDVSMQLNYSEVYLNRKFKDAMGTTFIEFLNRYRIQVALDMIKKGDTKIQDISWKCGVGEYKYFNIVFKKYIGCTPKEYLKLITNHKK